jgi:hypothetical protein
MPDLVPYPEFGAAFTRCCDLGCGLILTPEVTNNKWTAGRFEGASGALGKKTGLNSYYKYRLGQRRPPKDVFDVVKNLFYPKTDQKTNRLQSARQIWKEQFDALRSLEKAYTQREARSPYKPARPLDRPWTSDTQRVLPQLGEPIGYDDVPFKEVELLHPPFDPPLEPDQIAWKLIDRPFTPVPEDFWARLDEDDDLPFPDKTDLVPGKHIRLVAAGPRRAADDSIRLDCIWQPISWRESARTNGRISRQLLLDGAPLWAWFDQKDLLIPPVHHHISEKDAPFGNRLAINLAVIVRDEESGKENALFQVRHRHHDASPNKIECGISESVHGNAGWPSTDEWDVKLDHLDILRTAKRCLWQEFGFPERETPTLPSDVPTFPIEIAFTALVVNRQELSPRLLGYAVVYGSLNDAEKASRATLRETGQSPSHPEFGSRKVGDAVKWEDILICPATKEAFASVFHHPDRFTPECRARLLYWLKIRFSDWDKKPDFEDRLPWI